MLTKPRISNLMAVLGMMLLSYPLVCEAQEMRHPVARGAAGCKQTCPEECQFQFLSPEWVKADTACDKKRDEQGHGSPTLSNPKTKETLGKVPDEACIAYQDAQQSCQKKYEFISDHIRAKDLIDHCVGDALKKAGAKETAERKNPINTGDDNGDALRLASMIPIACAMKGIQQHN